MAAATAAALLVAAGSARASSTDAWEAFRKDVAAACLAAARDQVTDAKATVDPFGSASYGLALLSGTPKGSAGEIRLICVYDKQTKTVELGGELPGE
jgi:hypothetical protein